MRIHLLALDGAFDMGLSLLLDTFSTARDLDGDGDSARIATRLIGVRQRVRTAQGLTVPVTPAARVPRPDIVVVPALATKTPESVRAALERRDVAEAGDLLRRWSAAGTVVAAACTGTFVLAEAGLLDGRAATTTWWLAPLFRERYPRVDLDETRMVVESDGVLTAGAAAGHLDLALRLVRGRSPALAARTARYLVVDARSSQGAYAIPDQLAHEDPVVERFERWARRHLADRFSLPSAARSVGASERTLARRLRAVLGKSPLSYVQDLRVERAVHLLRTTASTVDEIAATVGYASGVTLRTLLRRTTGHGLRELRARA